MSYLFSAGGELRDLTPILLVRFTMSSVRSLLAIFVKHGGGVAGSRCSPRDAAWRLCKCCSWKRNRCLSPTPPASPLPSGYAYTLIPIASSAPRCFAGYCLDPPTEFLRNSGERDATHLFYCVVRRVRIERETIEAFCRTRRETSCQNFACGCVLDSSWFAEQR